MTISANFPVTRPSILLDFSNQTVLDPRVTFARTTTAYYYDNKSAALAEQNLLTYSNTFTNAAWTALGLGTPVVGATDPAAGSTAYTLTASVGSAQHYIVQLAGGTSSSVQPIGSTFTHSVYLQAGAGAGSTTYATISFSFGPTGVAYSSATFNLSGAGSVTQSSAVGCTGGTALITQIGSTAWYRCSVTVTLISANYCYLTVQMNNTATPAIGSSGLQPAWTALGSETLLVYGAQLEQRSSPTVYTATTATAVNTYTPTLQTAAINAPRFDYDPVTRQSLGLLLEQASTNLALYSSDYTNATWGKTQCTITATADISPDGTQNASLMVFNTTSSARYISQTTTYTAAAYTISVFIKYYGQQFFQIQTSANGQIYCNFDLINGTVGTPSGSGSPTASIQNAGNGWYRCSLTFIALAASAVAYLCATNSLTSAANPAFAGNGFNGYLVWGAQVELAPSATSYIANTSIANTRNVDSASMTGTNFTSWYNYSGGTIYIEAASGNPTTAITPTSTVISDGTTNNRIGIFYQSSNITTLVQINNVILQNAAVALPSATVANTFYKTTYYFSTVGTGVSSVGQTSTTTSTSVNAPAVNQIKFGNSAINDFPLNGRIKKFAYYPLALTNTQIQSLSAN